MFGFGHKASCFYRLLLSVKCKICLNVALLLLDRDVPALSFTSPNWNPTLRSQFPKVWPLSAKESLIYILFPIMGGNHICDLSRETCHRALTETWMHPSRKSPLYFPADPRRGRPLLAAFFNAADAARGRGHCLNCLIARGQFYCNHPSCLLLFLSGARSSFTFPRPRVAYQVTFEEQKPASLTSAPMELSQHLTAMTYNWFLDVGQLQTRVVESEPCNITRLNASMVIILLHGSSNTVKKNDFSSEFYLSCQLPTESVSTRSSECIGVHWNALDCPLDKEGKQKATAGLKSRLRRQRKKTGSNCWA